MIHIRPRALVTPTHRRAGQRRPRRGDAADAGHEAPRGALHRRGRAHDHERGVHHQRGGAGRRAAHAAAAGPRVGPLRAQEPGHGCRPRSAAPEEGL